MSENPQDTGTALNEDYAFVVSADEHGAWVKGFKDGELVVKGKAEGRSALAQMEKLYDMWSSEIWPDIYQEAVDDE